MSKLSAEYDFIRYLASKKSVDDRALNRNVWDRLFDELGKRELSKTLRILEAGSGIGTMIERLLEWRLFKGHATLHAIDSQSTNIAETHNRLIRFAETKDCDLSIKGETSIMIEYEACQIDIQLECIDFHRFVERERGHGTWDLILAHAFLDLFDIQSVVPSLLSLLHTQGLCYFTLNYDGLSILEPEIDKGLDTKIFAAYHRTMDERVVGGLVSGDSRAGRHLLKIIGDAGGQILSAGSSDWVVYPDQSGYADDEAYFLHYIIQTIDKALRSQPDIEPERFAQWIRQRHLQIDRNELTYIAHQIDILGQWPGS